MTPRPWMLWAAAVAFLALLAGVQTVRLADAHTELAEAAQAHAEALAAASEAARVTEAGLRADIDKIQADAAKEKEIAKVREDALVESVRDGSRRLSIRAVCPGGPGIRAPSAGGGGAGVSRADIDPAAGVALIGIARDGDEAIRERNACVQAYEAVRIRISGDAAAQ